MILKYGSKGLKVRTIQLLLGLTVDGKFGSKTEDSVRDFQRKHGLVSDGIVGNNTNKAMLKAVGNSLVSRTVVAKSTFLPDEVPIKTLEVYKAISPMFSTKAQIKLKVGLSKINRNNKVLQLDDLIKLAHFIGQVREEVGYNFNDVENLNYNVRGLRNTFKVFRTNSALAYKYGRTDNSRANQIMIANIAYANKYGNGSVKSGDGWKYRGMGSMQITFKDNNKAIDNFIKRNPSILTNTNFTANPENKSLVIDSLFSGSLFWANNNLGNKVTSKYTVTHSDSVSITKVINRYTNSYDKRWENTKIAARLLKLDIKD